MLEQVDDSGKASVVSELGEKVTNWSEPAGQRGRGDETTHPFGVGSVSLAVYRRMDSPHLVWIDVDPCWKAASASDKSEEAAAILCEAKAKTSADPRGKRDGVQPLPRIPSTNKQFIQPSCLLSLVPICSPGSTEGGFTLPVPSQHAGAVMVQDMQGQSKSLTIGEIVECFPEVLNTGVQWLKVLKPGCQKGYRKGVY